MKLGDKILELRKKKGMSQESLGELLGVTRQTISNWELGSTSPNPEQLKMLSKELNISIDELLGNKVNDIKTSSNTEKLASIILKFSKIAIFLFVGVIIFLIIMFIKTRILKREIESRTIDETIFCKIYGEEHGYNIVYSELTGEPLAMGGDSYFADILDLDKYDDAHQIFNVINDYVKKNGGTCQMIKDRDLSDIVDIEIKDLTKTSMKIIIHDKNPNRIVYGSEFYIEKYANHSWESIPLTGENYGFNAMAYYVDENGILELTQDWTHMYGPLSKGTYRIVKNVFFESDVPVNGEDKFYIWQEFEIEN